MSDTKYTPTINEVRADYVRDHTHNYDEYQGTLTLTAMQEFYGEQFDRALTQHEAAIRRDQVRRTLNAINPHAGSAIEVIAEAANADLRTQIGDTNE